MNGTCLHLYSSWSVLFLLLGGLMLTNREQMIFAGLEQPLLLRRNCRAQVCVLLFRFTSPTLPQRGAIWAAAHLSRHLLYCDWCCQHGYCWPPAALGALPCGRRLKPRRGHHVLWWRWQRKCAWPFSVPSDLRLLTEDYRARELKEGCLDCGIDIDAS